MTYDHKERSEKDRIMIIITRDLYCAAKCQTTIKKEVKKTG